MRRAYWIGLAFLATTSYGQDVCKSTALKCEAGSSFSISLLLDTISNEEIQTFVDEHVRLLEEKEGRFPNKVDFARFVFKKTQNKFLDTYVKYSDFSRIFEKGQFNCLTGTALFAYIYKQLGFEVRMFETRCHSFLQIQYDEVVALIETTDSNSGFVAGKEEVEQARNRYIEKEKSLLSENLAIPIDKYPEIRAIEFRQLAGLQFFNRGVVAVNEGRYLDAVEPLETAVRLYPESERIHDLMDLTAKLLIDPGANRKYINSREFTQDLTLNNP